MDVPWRTRDVSEAKIGIREASAQFQHIKNHVINKLVKMISVRLFFIEGYG